MTNKNYKQLEKVIIKAIPGILKKISAFGKTIELLSHAITLSDILIALQNQRYYNDINIITSHKKQEADIEVFNINGKITCFTWSLMNNSLYWHWENQRKTCVALFSILYKDKDIKNE